MGENCRIMCEIADAMREEEEHRRWANENGYSKTESNCDNCEKIQELRRQVEYWKQKYYNAVPIEKEFSPDKILKRWGF